MWMTHYGMKQLIDNTMIHKRVTFYINTDSNQIYKSIETKWDFGVLYQELHYSQNKHNIRLYYSPNEHGLSILLAKL